VSNRVAGGVRSSGDTEDGDGSNYGGFELHFDDLKSWIGNRNVDWMSVVRVTNKSVSQSSAENIFQLNGLI
jgi:hypothetical protein